MSLGQKRKYNLVSLFAGIGGFELAFDAIAKTTLMCEIDNIAQSVLKYHLPTVPLIGDIKELQSIPSNTDILCAGFPCQDISSVGIKRGMTGSRSSLIMEVFRLLEKNRPEWVVIENVSFMLSLKGGETIKIITTELGKLGYKWAYRTIDSISFVPQHRCRVYIVASLNNDPRNVILSDCFDGSIGKVDFECFENPLGFYWTEGRNALGLISNGIPTLKAGSTIGIPSPPAIVYPNGEVFTPDICDAESLQGFPADWTLPVIDIAKASFRWRLVGNAVTVDTVRWIAKKINRPKEYDATKDILFNCQSNWPKSAWNIGDGIYISNSSLYPQNTEKSLTDYIIHEKHPLSLKATMGFLKRLEEGRMKHPQYFENAIVNHIDNYNR